MTLTTIQIHQRSDYKILERIEKARLKIAARNANAGIPASTNKQLLILAAEQFCKRWGV